MLDLRNAPSACLYPFPGVEARILSSIPVWADIFGGLRPHSSSWELFGQGKPRRGRAGPSSALCCCGSLGHSCASCICSLMVFATTRRDLVRWCPQFAGPLRVPSPWRRLLPEGLKSQPCWTSVPCFLSTSMLPVCHSPGFHWGWVWGHCLSGFPASPETSAPACHRTSCHRRHHPFFSSAGSSPHSFHLPQPGPRSTHGSPVLPSLLPCKLCGASGQCWKCPLAMGLLGARGCCRGVCEHPSR